MKDKLGIIGKSDATLTILMDILESRQLFPHLYIVNNVGAPIEHSFHNPRFIYELVDKLPSEGIKCVLGVTNPSTKMKLVENLSVENMNFVGLIHNNAYLSSVGTIGKGFLANTFVTVGAHTKIGDFVTFSTKSTVGHHVQIADYVTLNPGSIVSGHTIIGKGTSIGAGAVVKDHVCIGENVIIGAGAVVVKDIPSNVIAYGNPCKPQRENGPRSA